MASVIRACPRRGPFHSSRWYWRGIRRELNYSGATRESSYEGTWVLEFVVPTGEQSSFSKVLDLNMLVMNGGCERTAKEVRALFVAAGLKMTTIIPTLSPLSVFEAVPG